MSPMALASLAFSALVLAGAPARSDTLLAAIDGAWKGSGWVKRSAASPREAVRCRIATEYAEIGQRLTVSGKCVTPGKKVDLDGMIASADGRSRYVGRWSNPFGIGSAAVHGTRQGQSINLRFTAKDPETNESVDQAMTWRITEREFTMSSHANAAKDQVLSSIVFRR